MKTIQLTTRWLGRVLTGGRQHLIPCQTSRSPLRHALALLVSSCLVVPSLALAQNRPPVVDAGPDQSIYTGEATTLAGSAIDPDNDPIRAWQWTVESAPTGSTPFLPYWDRQSTPFIGDVAGTYVISLIASDGFVWSEPDYVTITVADLLPPEAVADATPTTGTAPLVVQFDASQSYDPQGGSLVYIWDFGDFSDPSYEAAPSHVYQYPGTYVAILSVVDELGQSAIDGVRINVEATGSTAPVVSPTATPTSGSAPLSVQFAANASDADGDSLTYAWDFGDGAGSNVADPAHVFTAPGTYTVTVTVSDGQADTFAEVTIVVDPAVAINVAGATIKWTGTSQSVMGNASAELITTPGLAAPEEVIRLSADGVELFAAPFSEFKLLEEEEGLVYQYNAKQRLVKWDLLSGHMTVVSRKLNLASIDNSNGVDLVLYIGDLVCMENVVMTEAPGRKLIYTGP